MTDSVDFSAAVLEQHRCWWNYWDAGGQVEVKRCAQGDPWPCLPYLLARQAVELAEDVRDLTTRARDYERLAAINFNTAEHMEAERDEACEAILRVEAFCEQMETEKFWLEYGGPAVAAVAGRIRAELKPQPTAR